MADARSFDIIVIGLGPGGEAAAGRLAEAGLSVLGIDSHLVGGECPYWGCVPSKMMVRAADALAEARRVDGLAGAVRLRLVRLPDVQIWRSLDDVPADLGRTAVVIGNFDGVHLGHQHVVREARSAADTEGLRVVAVTFDPHPMAVLRPEHAPTSITDIETRAELLRDAGVDDVLALPFDRDVASWSPQEFARRVLADVLHAAVVVVGANFRYGSRASGDVATLTASGEELGFRAIGVPLDGGPQVWSSTYVRTCLATGDVAGAAEALGRPFVVRGVVVRGDRRGRELGFPTANVPTRVLTAAPADGVYAGWLRRLDTGERFPAAISVGTNPTFDGERERRVESYVLDRDDLELYDVEVEVSFVDRIRGMERFDGVDALIETMHKDVRRAHDILGRPE